MARTITTKLAIEGESEYKAKLKNINAELSLHKSELEKTAAKYKDSANSMVALTAKQSALEGQMKALNQKHDEQVAMLEKARKAQKEFSDQAEELRKRLDEVKNSSADTTEEEKRLNEEIAAAEESLQKATNSATYYQRQLNITERDQANLSTELEQTKRYLDEAEASTDECAKSIDKYGKEVKEAGEESEDFGNKSKKGIEQLAAALAAAGVAKTVKEIADALMECAKAAEGFETSMAKVSTLVDTSVVPLESLKAQFLELSSETGVAVGALSEAAYQALSAGVDIADVVNFVATATKTSAAGFTEASTAVDVLTTAINSYKLEGTEAERVASMLVKTQDEGKTSVGELAANMGRVIPSAAAYNVSLENLTTAYAILTKSGTNTAISTTNLGAMFDELAKNGSNVADILQERTGKSFSELMASGSSLGDIMTILYDSVDGNSTAFSNLWSSSTAGKAALSLLNAGAEEFDRTLNVMANSSGAVERNFQIMANTTEFAHQRMTNAAENLKIAVGDQLNPALEKLYTTGADAFTWATDFVNENPWLVQAITGAVTAIGLLSAGFAAYTAVTAAAKVVQDALNLSMSLCPILAVTAAAGALIAVVGSWIISATEASEQVKEFTASLEETKTAYEDLSAAMEDEQASTAATLAALENLLAVEEKSATQKENIKQLVEELNEAVPDLGLAYIETAGFINMTTEALGAMIEKSAEQEEMEAAVARLTELRKEEAQIAQELKQAEDELTAAKESGAWFTNTEENNVKALTAAQEENAKQIAELEAATAEYTAAKEAAAAKTAEMTSAVEGLISEMEALQAAYEESYNSAMESIDKQLGLFNELDGSAKTSIDNLIETLQGQISYMETYAANIQRAMELGVDEGLIRKLSDGSEESAQILAAIVEGGEEDIAALNEQLAKVGQGKEAFSQTVAEMETDFSNQMEDLVRDLDKAIQNMDLSDDAYIIGESNMQGLIDGTASKRAELVNKYAEMGRAALNAYKREVEQASPSKKFREAGRFDIQGIINGAEQEKENLAETYADAGRTALLAMEQSLPSNVEEPSTSAALNSQTAAIVAAVQSRGGGGSPIQIYVDKLEVRDDSDIERVARELYYLTERESRSRGGGSL